MERKAEGAGPASCRLCHQGAPSRAQDPRHGGVAGAGLGGARAALSRPEECGLWLVPCLHSGRRRNVNRVFTELPECTSSVPSRQRTPGSSSGTGPLSAAPQSPQYLRVEDRALRTVRPAGTQDQDSGRGALRPGVV